MLIVDFVPEALRSDCVAARIKVPTKFWKTQLIIVRGCVWLHLPTPSLGRKRLHLAYTMRSESALHKKICTEHIRFICVLYLRQNRHAQYISSDATHFLITLCHFHYYKQSHKHSLLFIGTLVHKYP